MVDASVSVRQTARKGLSGSWLRSVAVTAVAAAGALTGLDMVGRPAPPPLLRGSFVGSRAVPEVRLAPAPTPAPTAAAAPPPRTGPIDVPADSYAMEEVVQIGTIEIPVLGVRQRLMHGVTLRNIDRGPSHWPGTAAPGEAGNMVVAGHRVTNSRPFRDIDRLVPGDEVVVTAGDRRASYRVSSSFVVTPDRIDIANPTPTPTLTLFACHPPGSARLRYVVTADLLAEPAV